MGPVLADIIGSCRICFVYSGDASDGSVECVGLVAGRVLDIQWQAGGIEVVFQPGVLTTRTALLLDESAPDDGDPRFGNPYIYKLRLSRI